LAISEGLRSQVRGNQQAIRNANDGFGFLATADGALGELTNIAQRIRELSLQAATGSVSTNDRNNLNSEVQELLKEFDRIAKDTEFNGARLLDGSFTTTELQVGIRKGQTISFNIGNARTSQLGAQAILSGAQNNINAAINGLVINDVGIGNSVTDGVSSAGSTYSAIAIAEAINNKSGETKVFADVLDTSVTINDLDFSNFIGTLEQGDFKINNVSITGDSITNVNSFIDAINLQSQFSGVKASLVADSTDDIQLIADDGRNIQVEVGVASAGFSNMAGSINEVLDGSANFTTGAIFGGYDAVLSAYSVFSVGTGAEWSTFQTSSGGGFSVGSGFSEYVVSSFADGIVRTGAVQLRAAEDIVVGGSNVSQALGFSAQTIQVSNTTALDSVAITTASGASDALAVVDSVIRKLTDLRAGLGAIQSRLQTSVANLSITSENLAAAQSQIRDADIAVETAELTRAQILQQAGIAVLAQANTTSQAALQLLRF
jgi:flagellin